MEIECGKCNKGTMQPINGMYVPAYPPAYPYKCSRCGHTKNVSAIDLMNLKIAAASGR